MWWRVGWKVKEKKTLDKRLQTKIEKMFKECVSTKYREKKLKLGVWQFVLQKEKKRVCDKQKEKERDKSTSKR
jgi:hypothetical protein